MDENLFLTLVSGTVLTEKNGNPGLILNGRVCFARSAGQACVLRALAQEAQPLDSVTAMLRSEDFSDEKTALAIADFILDFGDYLSGKDELPPIKTAD